MSRSIVEHKDGCWCQRILWHAHGLQLNFAEKLKISNQFLCSLAFNSLARRAKLKTNPQKALHNPGTEPNFVVLFGAFSLHTLSVTCDANSRRLKWITCHK